MSRRHCVVVGAGLAGATAAWMISQDSRWRVTVYEADTTVGGNLRAATLNGVPYEPHGPHIFHTDSSIAYWTLSQHARLNGYQHRVKTQLADGRQFTWPLQKSELKVLPEWRQIAAELDGRPAWPEGTDLETYAVSLMGKTLYEWFCEHYTRKQWGMEPRTLSSSFAPKRLDLRDDDDPRMFRNQWQGWVDGGFHTVVESMLRHVPVHLGYTITVSNLPEADAYVVTSPLDVFLGEESLPWRGVRTTFKHLTVTDRYLDAPVVNRPGEDVTFTRQVETRQMASLDAMTDTLGTVVATEYPGAVGVRHYPVDDVLGENRARHREMVTYLKEVLPTVVLAGRLARYVYIDMDQAITQGVNAARRVIDMSKT